MMALNDCLESSLVASPGDTEAIKHLERELAAGKHWYVALLEAMGMWASAEEVHNDRTYRYLIAGEAFDWMLLAERLCESVDGMLPDDEKKALLFSGKPPLGLNAGEVKKLIGDSKYGQYLNYFYGFTIEEALLLTVLEEVYKERHVLRHSNEQEVEDRAYQRIYGAAKAELLKQFRREKKYPQRKSVTRTELKEFTYWLFKYRLKNCEPARVASDTRKALDYLKRQWLRKGLFGVLAADGALAD
ncbi:hypothetical protein ACFLVB_02735 [Chloroflexota bacterium]